MFTLLKHPDMSVTNKCGFILLSDLATQTLHIWTESQTSWRPRVWQGQILYSILPNCNGVMKWCFLLLESRAS